MRINWPVRLYGVVQKFMSPKTVLNYLVMIEILEMLWQQLEHVVMLH